MTTPTKVEMSLDLSAKEVLADQNKINLGFW